MNESTAKTRNPHTTEEEEPQQQKKTTIGPGDDHPDDVTKTSIEDNSSSQSSEQPTTTTALCTIKNGPKGRGLFSCALIPPGTLIHEAPCIRVVQKEYDNFMRFTVLEHYLFNATNGDKLLALGYGSLFNHSRCPNVDYRIDASNLCIRYFAGHRTISMDEELCISYGGNLWFDDASTGSQESSESEAETVEGMASFLNRIEL